MLQSGCRRFEWNRIGFVCMREHVQANGEVQGHFVEITFRVMDGGEILWMDVRTMFVVMGTLWVPLTNQIGMPKLARLACAGPEITKWPMATPRRHITSIARGTGDGTGRISTTIVTIRGIGKQTFCRWTNKLFGQMQRTKIIVIRSST